jgi:hypothetical protein
MKTKTIARALLLCLLFFGMVDAMGQCPVETVTIRSNSSNNVICGSGIIQLSSSSATGNQWYKNGVAIAGAVQSGFSATATGAYTDTVTDAPGCTVGSGPITIMAVDPGLSTPAIYPSSAVTLCMGDSLQLSSSLTAGNQWYRNGVPIVGDSGGSIEVSLAGSYTVQAGLSGCVSMSPPVVVTTGSAPDTPTITVEGANSLCLQHSILLLSSSDSNNSWFLNGGAIDSANGVGYTVTQPGAYTVVLNAGTHCAVSSAVTIIQSGLDSLKAIITPSAGVLYSDSANGNQWYLNDTLIAGATAKTYTPTVAGIYTLRVAGANGCVSDASAPDTVTAADLASTGATGSGSVQIFPNPVVVGVVTIVPPAGSTATIQVYDITGHLFWSRQGVTGPVMVDCSGWAKGVYAVLVMDELTRERKRGLVLKL